MGNKISSFIPTMMYGIEETSDFHILSNQILKKFNLIRLPRYIQDNNGYNFVYGFEITLDELINEKYKENKDLQRFNEFMKEKYNITFTNPEIHLCMNGDYDVDIQTQIYNYTNIMKYNNKKDKKDKKDESEENEFNIIEEEEHIPANLSWWF